MSVLTVQHYSSNYLHLMPRFGICGAIPPLVCLHGMVPKTLQQSI